MQWNMCGIKTKRDIFQQLDGLAEGQRSRQKRKLVWKQIQQAEVKRPSGQSYAVTKQPGDSSKEPHHGRFPRLCEGIYTLVCACVGVHAGKPVCVCEMMMNVWFLSMPSKLVTAQQVTELHCICSFFFFFFSSWCTFYLFSNYVFIFYGVHRVLTVANTHRRVLTSA